MMSFENSAGLALKTVCLVVVIYTVAGDAPAPSRRSIVVYQKDYRASFNTIYLYSSGGKPSYADNVDGSNAGQSTSFIVGYKRRYEQVKTGLWPNKKLVRGGFEQKLRVCNLLQQYEGGSIRTHLLTTGSCYQVKEQFGLSGSISTVSYVYVSGEERNAASGEITRPFFISYCRGYHDIVYSSISTSQFFCPNDDSRIQGIVVHAFGGEIFCPELEDFAHQDVHLTKQYGVRASSAVFSCSTGYRLSDGASERMTCSANGQWSGTRDECVAVDCGNPPSVENGVYIGDSYSYRATVVLSCDEGYLPDSYTTTLQCGHTGHWTEHRANCNRRQCRQPNTPYRGQVIGGPDYAYGDEVHYKCMDNYRLEGASTSVCQADGTWSDPEPSCYLIECEPVLQPVNGERDAASFEVGSTVVFSCHEGFELHGSSHITCDQDGDHGTWDSAPPTCEAYNCGPPRSPMNGNVHSDGQTYLSRAQFSCDTGFVLQGAQSATCLETGWNAEVPTCQEISCNDPGTPQNGIRKGEVFTYNSVVQFVCNPGYTIDGTNTIICQETGAWSDRTPSCHAINCPPLPALANGTRMGDVFEFNFVVTFSCFPGYELHGDRSTECLASRQWSRPVPNCIPCEVGMYKEGVDGERCVACPDRSTNYMLASSSRDHCMCEAGTRKSEDGATCEDLTCNEISAPDNGVIVECDNTFGGYCSFDCNEGHVLRGRSSIRCENYGWGDSMPYCQVCPANTYKGEAGSRTCHPCQRNAHTNGVPGNSSEDCVCREGYQLSELGACVDIDECSRDNPCDQDCYNTPGSYLCRCSRPGDQLGEDGHTCISVDSCDAPGEMSMPANGNLTCRYTESENSYICHIDCNAGYFFVSGQNNYVTCGQTTNFIWSHKLVNHTALLPGCAEEFFVDTQLPISFAYESSQSCENLTPYTGEVSDHISTAIYHLEACNARCSAINMDTECTPSETSTSRLTVNFDILLRNLEDPDPAGDNCDPRCKQNNMRQMLAATYGLKTAIEDVVQNNSSELVPSDVITAETDSDSFEMGKLLLICQEQGRVLTRQRMCVPCSAGYFLADREDDFCSPCPVGTYQMNEGQLSCTPCPLGSSTLTEASTHPTMCSQAVSVLQGPDGAISQYTIPQRKRRAAVDEDIDIDEVLGFLDNVI